jgi:uncharacterized membrane protein YhaH (DUF805 family)
MKKFLFDHLRPSRPGGYLFFVAWLLMLTYTSRAYRPVEILAVYSVTLFTMRRLSDAGLNRLWVFVMLPTIMAGVLCPLLIPGVRPSSVWAQLLDGLFYNRNWRQAVLALALLAVPLAIGILPTRQPSPKDATEPQATPAAQQ